MFIGRSGMLGLNKDSKQPRTLIGEISEIGRLAGPKPNGVELNDWMFNFTPDKKRYGDFLRGLFHLAVSYPIKFYIDITER